MPMNWQTSGGLSYVESVHHRGTQCYVNHGSLKHDVHGKELSLREFQPVVKPRHRVGSAGIHEIDAGSSADFQPM